MSTIEYNIHEQFRLLISARNYEDKSSKLAGFFEQGRFNLLPFDPSYVQLVEANILGYLSGTIYRVFHDSRVVLSSVVASYDETPSLWLDDDVYDDDYWSFFQKENLLHWLPEQYVNLSHLLTVTKLNYLGYPRVVSNVDDVPWLSNERRELHVKVMGEQEVLEREKELQEVTQPIHAPVFTSTGDHPSLTFFVWSWYFGRLIKVNFSFSQEQGLKYSGTEIANRIGDWTNPR